MYGQPLVGYLETPKELSDRKILVVHGRQDTTIPILGGVDDQNQWIYEPEDKMLSEWAKMQECDLESYREVETPYDGNATDFIGS